MVDADRKDREAMRGILETEGYLILQAADYWDAIDVYRAHPGQVNLLLTALALPGDNGYELARTLFRDDEHLKLLFVSAPTGAEVSPYYHMPTTGPHILVKPINPEDLIDRVRTVLATKLHRFKAGHSV